MAEAGYTVTDVAAMTSAFDAFEARSTEESSLLLLDTELRNYLRVAPGRSRASDSKVALGLALLDVWTRHGAADLEPLSTRDTGHVMAAALVAVGAATARPLPTRDEAGEAARQARRRVEEALAGNEPWQELWSMAGKLGAQTGFRMEVDARRAERIWRALFEFVIDPSPLLFPALPETMPQLLWKTITRGAATDSAMLSELRRTWPSARYEHWGAGTMAGPLHEVESAKIPEEEGWSVPVWFGTNRIPLSLADVTSGYSNKRDSAGLHFGRCMVRVPPPEAPAGGIRRFVSTWLRRRSSRGSPFQVESYFRFNDNAKFQQALDDELAHVVADERSVLVFIHGYNTTFRAAAETAAKLSVKIKHPGATALFSWASRGSLIDYIDDERTVDVSGDDLTTFLQTLTSIVDFEHIDLVVHSLGNRLFLRTLIDYFTNGSSSTWRFRNLFLGAPDIDQSEYVSNASFYQKAADKATMYGSAVDSALLASQIFHRGIPRAGLMPPVAWAPGVDAVDTSGVNQSRLGHNVLLDVPALHADATQILAGILDPDRRANLMKAGPPAQPYWRF